MGSKNYLIEELTKEENDYIKKTIKSAKIDYLRKNIKFFNTELCDEMESIVDEQCSVLDTVIKKCDEETSSAIEFEKAFSDVKIYKVIKALSYNEKMMLFYLYQKNRSVRETARLQNIDKDTVRRRRDKILKIIENILGDGEDV